MAAHRVSDDEFKPFQGFFRQHIEDDDREDQPEPDRRTDHGRDDEHLLCGHVPPCRDVFLALLAPIPNDVFDCQICS